MGVAGGVSRPAGQQWQSAGKAWQRQSEHNAHTGAHPENVPGSGHHSSNMQRSFAVVLVVVVAVVAAIFRSCCGCCDRKAVGDVESLH